MPRTYYDKNGNVTGHSAGSLHNFGGWVAGPYVFGFGVVFLATWPWWFFHGTAAIIWEAAYLCSFAIPAFFAIRYNRRHPAPLTAEEEADRIAGGHAADLAAHNERVHPSHARR
jgi:hypothetical protein